MDIKKEEIFKICGLCLEFYDSYHAVDDVTKKMMAVLQLNRDLSTFKEPIICDKCMGDIHKHFNFKSSCLHVENYINSFANKDNVKLDLTEVYLNKNDYENIESITEEHAVCRLCMKLVKCDCSISLLKETKDPLLNIFLNKYLSELDLNITQDPVICTSCHGLLQDYSHFMEKCSGTEAEVKYSCKMDVIKNEHQIQLNDNPQYLQNNMLKSENDYFNLEGNSVKVDRYEETIIKQHLDLDVNGEETKNEHEEIGIVKDTEKDSHLEDAINKSQPESSSNGVSATLRATYICMTCLYEFQDQQEIKRHIKLHGSALYRKVRHCNVCAYKSTQITNITRHMLIHKPESEVTWYPCDVCDYKAKSKQWINQHMLIHKAPSEVIMHKCTQCEYQTRHKRSLGQHERLIHQKGPNPQLYTYVFYPLEVTQIPVLFEQAATCQAEKDKAEKCKVEKHKAEKAKSVLLRYKCNVCDYKSKYKWCLQNHELLHKDNS